MFPDKVFYNGSIWEMGYSRYFGTGYCKLTSNLRRHPKGKWMHQMQMLSNLKNESALVANAPNPSDEIIETTTYKEYLTQIKNNNVNYNKDHQQIN